ncbi:MAG: methylenetetrahydrofolate reductase, partial [Burkholderiaceae bacterium]
MKNIPISFEFFPPNTPTGVEKLRATRASLQAFKPEFFSVTYGAGGAAQAKTMNTVLEMKAEGLSVAPHISCIGSTRDSIEQLLAQYHQAGI